MPQSITQRSSLNGDDRFDAEARALGLVLRLDASGSFSCRNVHLSEPVEQLQPIHNFR
ncbi:MAG: hypothetical protein JWS10_1493 [Cypionkella sp.]|nr:hypothetical protein [Cypionkella sp.]